MKRLELDIKGAQAASLEALGRIGEATAAREAGQRVTDDIAGSIRDEQIRREFLTGAAQTLGTARV